MIESGETKKREIITVDYEEFLEYFSKLSQSEVEFEVRMYRVKKKLKGEEKTYIKKYENYLPDEDEIGDNFGGGKFWLAHYLPDGNRLVCMVRIDDIFTERLLSKKGITKDMDPDYLKANNKDPLEYMSRVVRDMIKPMMDVVQGQGQGQGNQSADTMADIMGKMMSGVTDNLVTSLGKIQNAVVDKQLSRIEDPGPEKEEKQETLQEKMGFIKELVDLAKTYGGDLLKATGAKEKGIKNIIKSDERYKQVEADQALIDTLYSSLVYDHEIGEEKAKAIFAKLGFDVNNVETATDDPARQQN